MTGFKPFDSLVRSTAIWTRLLGLLPSIAIAAALAIAGIRIGPASAENTDIGLRRASERTNFSNDEIADGFFKVAFGSELQLGRPVNRLRRFDEPVRVFVDNRGAPGRRSVIKEIVADIGARVRYLDLAMSDDRRTANLVVTLVPTRDFARTIRSFYGPKKASQIQRTLSPRCLSGIGSDERYRIRRAEVILPADADEFIFYDCAYEELLQSLGVINDNRSVPWTMFNDNVQMGFFDVYDQYLLNILYDPRIRPGMNRDEVNRLLPEVLPAVRARMSGANPRLGADARTGPGPEPK